MVAMKMQISISGSQGVCFVEILLFILPGRCKSLFLCCVYILVRHCFPGLYLYAGLHYLEELWELLVVKAVCQKIKDLRM